MAIDKAAVLEVGFSKGAALPETGFFENLYRCRVIFINMGMDPYYIGMA